MAAENAACITCFRKVKRLRLPFDYGASSTVPLHALRLHLQALYTIVLTSFYTFYYGPDRDLTDRSRRKTHIVPHRTSPDLYTRNAARRSCSHGTWD